MIAAQWDIPYDQERAIRYCDDKGELSISVFADNPRRGITGTVVGRRSALGGSGLEMDLEEPTVAPAISQALNTGHQLALRTSELTAVAVLKGEIIVQLPMHLGERVAFQTVRDRVRHQLDDAADDPTCQRSMLI